MTAEQVLSLHSEGVNQALKRQDYGALEKIYSQQYMLVRPDSSVLNKQAGTERPARPEIEVPLNRA
jgi:hypothetical protein